MSLARNLLGQFVPVRERREGFGVLAALNAELVVDLNGDESALVYVQSTAFVGTLEFTGASNNDGTQFFPVAAYPYAIGCAGGTIPLAGQPLLLDALVAANTARVYSVPVGQLKRLRIRASAYTSGAADITVVADTQRPLNKEVEQSPSTLLVTATAAVGVAVTATLPAVAGLRHVVDFVQVVRSATAALTASATPVIVTTTNMPGAMALTFGADVGGIGVDREVVRDFSARGLACTALGTATTVVCPAYAGVIWRATVGYRLGL